MVSAAVASQGVNGVLDDICGSIQLFLCDDEGRGQPDDVIMSWFCQ